MEYRRDNRGFSLAAHPTGAEHTRMRSVIIVQHDEAVRVALASNFNSEFFHTRAHGNGASALNDYRKNGADLLIVGRELAGSSGLEVCQAIRQSPGGGTIALVLMSVAYQDPFLGASECRRCEADAFIPLPAPSEMLQARVEAALARREPVERLQVLPDDLAQRLDRLFATYESLDYYALLEVPHEAPSRAIKKAFHQLSMLLHPDRHVPLRQNYPAVYDKVNAVYKRIVEAHQVLTDNAQRQTYDTRLQRGDQRLLSTEVVVRPAHLQRELDACDTDEARRLIIRSHDLRAVDDLTGAAKCVAKALQHEPQNRELRYLYMGLRKLALMIREAHEHQDKDLQPDVSIELEL